MKHERVDKVAEAVLYEGYLLYPYRPSVKNRQRWTFGGLFPQTFSEAHGSDTAMMQCEVLAVITSNAIVKIKTRFLQPIERLVGRFVTPQVEWNNGHKPDFEIVPSLQVEDQTFHTWQEAMEREVDLGEIGVEKLIGAPLTKKFTFGAGVELQPLKRSSGEVAGVLVRQQRTLTGVIECSAINLDDGLSKITIKVSNQTYLENPQEISRDEAQLQAFASTHIILGIEAGEFVSLTDPPEALRGHAALCNNIGTWPVLIGDDGDRDTMLSAPIILYDYPQVAPESAGDLFDATEIDEILTLRIMTMTDEEKKMAASIDQRARALLQRTEALSPEQLLAMHGTMREVRPREETNEMQDWNPLAESPKLEKIRVAGVELKPGDKVRLRPSRRADIFDMALDGKIATIVAIEQDYEERIHLAVTVDVDPGKDWGQQNKIGHRFFFRPEEVEPLAERSESP